MAVIFSIIMLAKEEVDYTWQIKCIYKPYLGPYYENENEMDFHKCFPNILKNGEA